MGPLAGIRVADFTIAAVGPWSTMLLATLGADVIKVEPPRGDIARAVPPDQGGLATVWIHCNLGKRSVCLDLKRPNHLEAALKLIKRADVLVENMRPGTARRLGISYEQVSPLNDRLIYCSASGYGQSGPMKEQGGSDGLSSAFAGWVSMTGERGGRGEFLRYVAHSDLMTAAYVTAAVLLGLNARETTGRGQQIEVSMLEASLDVVMPELVRSLMMGIDPVRAGSADAVTAPHQSFIAGDGEFVCIGVTDEETWHRFCLGVPVPDLMDPRFATNESRLRNRLALEEILSTHFATRPAEEWVDLLRDHGVPCSTVWTREEVMNDEHIRGNGHIQEVTTPVGPVDVSGPPWTFDQAELAVVGPSSPGSDTEVVMAEIDHALDGLVPDVGKVVSTF